MQTIYLTITPYRDTTLLQVRGFAPAGSNALTLVRMSISVLKDHFDAIAKTHRGDKVRADDAMPAEQKTMAIAVAEGIPCSVIEVVDPPTVLVE